MMMFYTYMCVPLVFDDKLYACCVSFILHLVCFSMWFCNVRVIPSSHLELKLSSIVIGER